MPGPDPWTDGEEYPSDLAFTLWLEGVDPEKVAQDASALRHPSPEEVRAIKHRIGELRHLERVRIPGATHWIKTHPDALDGR